MEHEVFVPFPATVVRRALAEPERVASCVPGLQLDAPNGGPDGNPAPVAAARPMASGSLEGLAAEGRLRLRIGGSTITYRGTASLVERGEGVVIEAEGNEARGSGTARLVLSVVSRPAAGGPGGAGTTLSFSGLVEGKGRITELAAQHREAAGRRLLDRFATALAEGLVDAEQDAAGGPEAAGAAAGEGLVEELTVEDGLVEEVSVDEPGDIEPGGAGAEPPRLTGGIGGPDDNDRAIPGIPAPEGEPRTGPRSADGADAVNGTPEAETEAAGAPSEPDLEPDAGLLRGGGDGDVPPAALEPDLESEPNAEPLLPAVPAGQEASDAPEADVARRTMIGRSAEEVDHAPPRGRYAPEPAPGPCRAPSSTLRSAVPVAVVAVASVVVLRRMLRRRG